MNLSRKLSSKNQMLIQVGMMGIIVGIAVVVGILLFILARQITLTRFTGSNGSSPQFQSQQAQTIPGGDAQVTPGEGSPAIPAIEPTLTAWDGAGRVTILLLGLDYRDWEAGSGPSRSDTMILVTLDPLNHTAGILSIPRDMWVPIPGFQHGKINTAYFLGDAYKLPGGGPGLAVKTVEQFLGVPINYYAQVDFDAFIRFIDEIGGVEIDVPNPITIDMLGSGSSTKKKLQPGRQTLPGSWALAYARNRYTEDGDFDRARRQQQVLMGVRDRILSFNMLPTLIAKAPALYKEVSSGIHTNLSLEDATKLALLAKDVPKENIRQGVFGKEYIVFGWSPDHLSILIPIPDKIHVLRDEIFASSGALSPLATGTIQEKMQAENARVSIQNGSGAPDLAGRTGEYLRSMGVNVTAVSDAGEAASLTTVIDHSGKPYILQFLAEQVGISPNKILVKFDPNSAVDVELILGSDWAGKNPMP